ncbi:hypothetical protein N0B31_12545 [Salinirubellus salinus]|uniref:Uncharacterized protein n=1 Tax=Salinirubellus salinus TaxID=1364945 RepID=A0A9E7QZV4_9EURY|nr:hypothetical protein [Salinirubellus salinus]UWM52978.1 hypothetical protein N0B31_12545 [Salinirubellus salinus]
MPLTGPLYLLFSATNVTAGLLVAGLSARAYHRTQKVSMLHLAVGFTLVAAATLATVASLELAAAPLGRQVLLVEGAISTVGLLFVVYSVVTHT